jgi:hypothetical protein
LLTIIIAGKITLFPLSERHAIKKWSEQDVAARAVNSSKLMFSPETSVREGKSIVAASGDACEAGSWIVYDAEGTMVSSSFQILKPQLIGLSTVRTHRGNPISLRCF